MSRKTANKRVPSLRFPEFRDAGEWEERKLGELAEIVAGQSPEGAFYNETGQGLPFYQGKTDFGGVYLNAPTKWTSQITKTADAGDILMSVRAPVGSINVATQRICIGRGLAAIRSKEHHWFIYYLLLKNQKQIIGNGGSVFDSISRDQIMKLKFCFPRYLPEQQKIADCLGSLDGVISGEERKVAALRRHKQGLMQQLFPQPGQTRPQRRFPQFQNAGDWEEKKLGEVCEILNKKRMPVTSSSRKPGPYPYYGASGIVDYIDDYIFDERLVLVGEDGAKWGAFEATAFIAEGKYWVNNHAHVLKSKEMSDSLLAAYLTMTDIGPYVTGAAPPKLTLAKLRQIPIPVPALVAEQQKIAACLSSLDRVIELRVRKLESLKRLKQGLMQQLFPNIK